MPPPQLVLAETRTPGLHSAWCFHLEWYSVFAIIEAAGWPIWHLILVYVVAVAILIERA